MTRLFLSLYIFLIISILTVGYALDRLLFSQPLAPSPSQLAFVNLAQSMKNNPVELNRMLSEARAELNTMRLSQFSDVGIGEKLRDGQIVEGIQDGHWVMYIPTENEKVIVATFSAFESDDTPLVLYSALFFGFLGFALASWVFPFGRDLRKLSDATKNLKYDGTIDIPQIHKSSPLQSLVAAYDALNNNIQQRIIQHKQLASAITHEFKTPIARLKFALVSAGQYDKKQIQDINDDIAELEKLVQEMLDFSKLDTQEPQLHVEDIPLDAFCVHCINKFKTHTPIDITFQGDASYLLADGDLLNRALDNLINNAIRHAKSVTVVSIINEKGLKICVEDDGDGIHEKDKPHLFEPFYRADSHRSRISGGSGLGLTIVKRVMEWHNGSVNVSDSSLGGAKFTLNFPESAVRKNVFQP